MKCLWIGALLFGAPLAAQQIDPRDTTHEQIPNCVQTVRDQATGNCVGVSTVPTLGMLHPLGPAYFFDASGVLRLTGSIATQGDLGVGTSAPAADLHIRRNGSLEVLLQADADDNNNFEQPRIRFSSFGGVAQGFIGHQDGTTHLSLRNLTSAGGIKFDMHTSASDSWEFRRRASIATDVEARFTFNGNLQLDGSVSSPAADLAEFYPVAGPVEPGDLVAFTGDGLTLERARAGASNRLAGVISSRPAFVMGLSYTRADEHGLAPPALAAGMDEARARAIGVATQALGAELADELAEPAVDPTVLHEIEVNQRAPLALSGRIPCKVSAENGPIETGDLLTVSSIPGHAMKATASGAVIGTALEGWRYGEGTILVLANLGWFSATEDLERRMSELEQRLVELERR